MSKSQLELKAIERIVCTCFTYSLSRRKKRLGWLLDLDARAETETETPAMWYGPKTLMGNASWI